MKKELIIELFEKFEGACYLFNHLECWSARELQEILGYAEWRNFLKVIEKSKTACKVPTWNDWLGSRISYEKLQHAILTPAHL